MQPINDLSADLFGLALWVAFIVCTVLAVVFDRKKRRGK